MNISSGEREKEKEEKREAGIERRHMRENERGESMNQDKEEHIHLGERRTQEKDMKYKREGDLRQTLEEGENYGIPTMFLIRTVHTRRRYTSRTSDKPSRIQPLVFPVV